MLSNIKNNPLRFGMLFGAFALELASFIVYLCTGIIHNFTESYSAGCIVFLIIALLATLATIWKRIHIVETVPFIAMTIALILFIVVNLNYIVAVVRAIDVTSVNASFVITIVLMALSMVASLVSFCIKDKKPE